MNKKSVEIANSFCPQALFLFGTYKEDGAPNFGLFCWLSYCNDDGLHVMTCIGGEKLTKDRIHAGKMFSANLVTKSILPISDYFGNTDGYNPDKMSVPIEVMPGAVLNVPILKDSPWSYELEVEQVIPLSGSEIYICKIHNVIAHEALMDENKSIKERMRLADPVLSAGRKLESYFSLDPAVIGTWGEWAGAFAKKQTGAGQF